METGTYNEYLKSEYWQKVAKAVKDRAGWRCQVCNSQHNLEAHHRRYDNRGNELNHLDDLTCLCRSCHSRFHAIQTETPQPVVKVVERVVVREVAAKPPANLADTVFITRENHRHILCHKPAWHWLKDNGIDPRKKGWRKRAIGRFIPKAFVRN